MVPLENLDMFAALSVRSRPSSHAPTSVLARTTTQHWVTDEHSTLAEGRARGAAAGGAATQRRVARAGICIIRTRADFPVN